MLLLKAPNFRALTRAVFVAIIKSAVPGAWPNSAKKKDFDY